MADAPPERGDGTTREQEEPTVRPIINTWDQLVAAGGGVAISYRVNQGSRDVTPSRWQVWRIVDGKEVPTAPGAPWYDGGKKAFLPFGVGRKEALEKAKAWAEEQYGPQDFVRNRMGDYVPRAINVKHPIPKREAPHV